MLNNELELEIVLSIGLPVSLYNSLTYYSNITTIGIIMFEMIIKLCLSLIQNIVRTS